MARRCIYESRNVEVPDHDRMVAGARGAYDASPAATRSKGSSASVRGEQPDGRLAQMC
jgi:hypothetical protein